MFNHLCGEISLSLQKLGEKLIDNMEEANVESVFTETDFLDRTVLKLITHYEYEPLMRDHKISDLLDLLWVGKNSYDCDGRVTNFSLLSYLSIA